MMAYSYFIFFAAFLLCSRCLCYCWYRVWFVRFWFQSLAPL